MNIKLLKHISELLSQGYKDFYCDQHGDYTIINFVHEDGDWYQELYCEDTLVDTHFAEDELMGLLEWSASHAIKSAPVPLQRHYHQRKKCCDGATVRKVDGFHWIISWHDDSAQTTSIYKRHGDSVYILKEIHYDAEIDGEAPPEYQNEDWKMAPVQLVRKYVKTPIDDWQKI